MTERLSEEFRSRLRFFAFFIGNGSLVPRDSTIDYFFYYDELINHPSTVLGAVFAVYLNNYVAREQKLTEQDPQDRAAQYLMEQSLASYKAAAPFLAWELVGPGDSNTAIDAIKTFADRLGRGVACPDVLRGVSYHDIFVDAGSFLEQVFAIFANVLEIGEDQRVTNYNHAEQRAAQYVRGYGDPSYKETPPFEHWEVKLF